MPAHHSQAYSYVPSLQLYLLDCNWLASLLDCLYDLRKIPFSLSLETTEVG